MRRHGRERAEYDGPPFEIKRVDGEYELPMIESRFVCE